MGVDSGVFLSGHWCPSQRERQTLAGGGRPQAPAVLNHWIWEPLPVGGFATGGAQTPLYM